MKLNRFMTLIVAGWAAVVIAAIPGLAGQAPHATTPAKAKVQAGMAADMTVKCQAMMADQEKMAAEMKAADRRLDDLVGKMNAAAATDKPEAIAAVVTEMVAQRRAIRDGMMKLQHGMMGHMMEHMQAGKDSMTMCPMVKQMGGMKH